MVFSRTCLFQEHIVSAFRILSVASHLSDSVQQPQSPLIIIYGMVFVLFKLCIDLLDSLEKLFPFFITYVSRSTIELFKIKVNNPKIGVTVEEVV